MSTRNDDTSRSIDLGSTFLTLTSGAVLTPFAGNITPTASHHHVAAGTISTIATTSIDTNGEALLLLTADGNVVITTGATIVGHTTYLATNDEILYVLDGGTKWREVAVNHIVPVSGGGTGITSINDGDLIRGVNGSPANTFEAIAHPGTSTRKFLYGKVTLGISGFGYDQILSTDLASGFTLPVSKGGTGLTAISNGDLFRGVNGSPENTFQAIANPGSGTRLFLTTKTTLGIVGFTYVQPTFADHSDFTNWTTFTPTLTAATGTWSGGIVSARYKIEANTMTIIFYQQGGTISNNTATLQLTIPASKIANVSSYSGGLQLIDGVGVASGSIGFAASSGTLTLYHGPAGSGSWTASGAGNAVVSFVLTLEIT